MELLPEEGERRRLLEQLGRLIGAAGWATFVAAPIRLPDARTFPDAWTPDEAGVERVLRRLLDYAGLEPLELIIDLGAYAQVSVAINAHGRHFEKGHEGTAAWFAGIRTGVCSFGVDVHQLGDPAPLVGVLAHEVAHAFRHYHELQERDRAIEERLTDLTTVYLGFGVLTANASQGHTSGGDGLASWYRSTVRGYLSPQAMCWLLAAQVVARGDDVRRTARALAPNQAACFRAACKALARDELMAALALPPPASWPRLPTVAPPAGLWSRLFGRKR